MARIGTYPFDAVVTDNDAWIGTDASNRLTRQFTALAVANYLNLNAKVNVGGQMSFKWSNTQNGGEGTISKTGGNGTGDLISSLTQIRLAVKELNGQNVIKFLEYITTKNILIGQGSEISQFGHFTLTSYIEDPTDPNYYIADVAYIGGNGVIDSKDTQYTIIHFDIAGDKTYEFTQTVPATTWNIQHNLSKFPSITVIDTGNTVVIGQYTYIDNNNVTLNFSAGFAGKAYLN